MRPRNVFRSLLRRPIAEAPEPAPARAAVPLFRGSLQLRHVDVGSCNGCEIEISAALSPHYDAGRFGARLVASPRHADGLLVTGVPTLNMVTPLKKSLEATPEPRVVIACGDCAIDGGAFADGYAVAGRLEQFVNIDVHIPGCPPHPSAIVEGLRRLTGR